MNLAYTSYFIFKWFQSSTRDYFLESEGKEVHTDRWGSLGKGKEAKVLQFIFQNSLMMETQVVNLLLTGAMPCWKENVISTTQWESLKPRLGYRAQAEHRPSLSWSKGKGMACRWRCWELWNLGTLSSSSAFSPWSRNPSHQVRDALFLNGYSTYGWLLPGVSTRPRLAHGCIIKKHFQSNEKTSKWDHIMTLCWSAFLLHCISTMVYKVPRDPDLFRSSYLLLCPLPPGWPHWSLSAHHSAV